MNVDSIEQEFLLPTENRPSPQSVGKENEGGEWLDGRGLAVLEHPIEIFRFCPACHAETRFVIEYVLANAFFGNCVRCGDERVAAFERTVSEGE